MKQVECSCVVLFSKETCVRYLRLLLVEKEGFLNSCRELVMVSAILM